MWLSLSSDTDFSLYNLPFGIFRHTDTKPRAGIAIGDHIVDLAAAAEAGLFGKRRFFKKIFEQNTLNEFIALGKPVTGRVRRKVQEWLSQPVAPENADQILCDRRTAQMLLPIRVGNYTDFYSSMEHATNVGKMFRPDGNPLLPNWRWLPVGYHGRASSVVVSGTPIRRPNGQILLPGGAPDTPVFAASRQMDFELEVAFVVGKETALGEPIPVGKADEYIFGLLLFNDWSARDIQRWVPLGPFLGKNFGSSVSPWIVPLEALKPFRVKGPKQAPAPLDYLQQRGAQNYDLALEVAITSSKSNAKTVVSRSNFKYLYWSMAQQLAHHTVNGCNVQVGDLLASGTISGPEPGSYGSMLELSWGGKRPVAMADGTTRTFLEDGDVVTMRGWGEIGGVRVGFGEVRGEVV